MSYESVLLNGREKFLTDADYLRMDAWHRLQWHVYMAEFWPATFDNTALDLHYVHQSSKGRLKYTQSKFTHSHFQSMYLFWHCDEKININISNIT
jgi:hypothetical protein